MSKSASIPPEGRMLGSNSLYLATVGWRRSASFPHPQHPLARVQKSLSGHCRIHYQNLPGLLTIYYKVWTWLMYRHMKRENTQGPTISHNHQQKTAYGKEERGAYITAVVRVSQPGSAFPHLITTSDNFPDSVGSLRAQELLFPGTCFYITHIFFFTF